MEPNNKEWEKSELAVFWDEISKFLPKSVERAALGDEKIFIAFKSAYPLIKRFILLSHDKEMKERLEKMKWL